MDQMQINNNTISVNTAYLLLDAYTFVHDLQEPHCNHFKFDKSKILSKDTGKLDFISSYNYLTEVVNIQHSITVANTVQWEIQKLDALTNNVHCRFGISFPINNILIENDIVPESLINYEHHWRFNWKGQTNIDLPIVKINNSFYLTSLLEENVQFFTYCLDKKLYLKIVTMYEEDFCLNIQFSSIVNDYRENYCSLYPTSHDYIYQWKTLFNKIYQKYNIKVHCHQNISTSNLVSETLSEKELSDFSEMLEEELSFYPLKFLRKLGLKTITVCGNAIDHTTVLKGHFYNDGIRLNGSDAINNIEKRKTIHHELFHLLETKTASKQLDEKWNKFPDRDKFYEHYNLTRLNISAMDYRAELFAYFVIDPSFVQYMIHQDQIVKHKWELIINIIQDKELRGIISRHNQKKENVAAARTTMQLPLITKSDKAVKIFSIKHACVKLLQSILVDHIPVETFKEISHGETIVCLTLNPLDYCALEFKKHGISAHVALEEWINIHQKCTNLGARFLQSEKLYQSQYSFLRRFFAGLNVKVQVKLLTSCNDEMRSIRLDQIPELGTIWQSFRGHSILEKTGYHNISIQE